MASFELKRLFRPPHKALIESMAASLGAHVAICDSAQRVLWGQHAPPPPHDRHPILAHGVLFGEVLGEAAAAAPLAQLLGYLCEREQEKMALADETLARYKELTLLYNMSEALSRALDVDEVARVVVSCAQRFHRADEATLFLYDRRKPSLEPAASTNPAAQTRAASSPAWTALRAGAVEIQDQVQDTALACAPLRVGESSLGVLQLRHAQAARWNAGDLKLLSSLASQAAAALSNAMLYRDMLRQQALRGQIERIVSPQLIEAALAGRPAPESLVVLLCDLSHLAKTLDGPAESMVEALTGSAWAAVAALLDQGATVNAAHNEVIVALFLDPSGFEASARRAAQAAQTLTQILSPCPGIGLARASLVSWQTDPKAFFAGVSAAAALQASSEGRVLADEHISPFLPALEETFA